MNGEAGTGLKEGVAFCARCFDAYSAVWRFRVRAVADTFLQNAFGYEANASPAVLRKPNLLFETLRDAWHDFRKDAVSITQNTPVGDQRCDVLAGSDASENGEVVEAGVAGYASRASRATIATRARGPIRITAASQKHDAQDRNND